MLMLIASASLVFFASTVFLLLIMLAWLKKMAIAASCVAHRIMAERKRNFASGIWIIATRLIAFVGSFAIRAISQSGIMKSWSRKSAWTVFLPISLVEV